MRSLPIVAASFLLLVGCGRQNTAIRTLDDAERARIGVVTGSITEGIVRARFPKADVKIFDDAMDAVGALKAGQLGGFVTAFPTAVQVTKKNPDLVMLPEHLSADDTSVAIRQADRELLQDVDRVISELKSDGTLESMKKRWFKEDLSPYDEPKIDLPTEGTPLRVAVSATREPFSFVDKDGRITGHDGELARRIAAKLHRPIEFLNMKWMALIPALQSGKADLIITGMTATDERRKIISFSQPYFANAQVFLTRRAPGTQKLATAARGPASFFQSVARSFRSNILDENRYLLIWNGLETTVLISVLATVFGTLLGSVVCFLRMSRLRVLSAPAKIYISLLRGTPVLVVLMLIFYVVFSSVNISPVLVAVVAFGMNFAAYSSEIFRTGIEAVDRGQSEAALAMGFSRVQVFVFVVLPQTVRRILPVYKGEFISLVKMTSIVGYIAVQDLTKAGDIVRSRTFDAFFPLIMVAIVYFTISWVLMQSLGYLERATAPKYRRRRAVAV